MANKEHLAILKQGEKTWNQWRKENPSIQPNLMKVDLRGVDLSGMNLQDVDFFKADLSNANFNKASLYSVSLSNAILYNADFVGAKLISADLSEAYLIESNLVGANLGRANFTRTYLFDSNLSEANLGEATFHNAHLSGVNFTNASFLNTLFNDVDLSDVIGLESVHHWAASSIDIHTVYKSKGNIPETFLRGCGIPDVFIEFMGSLVGRPIEYYSCFISYSSKDQALAERLHADLQNNGVRCWYAPHDLRIGSKYKSGIDEAIRFHDKLLLILSENAIESGWVEHEVEKALEKERETAEYALFPIRIDDTVMEVDSGWAGHIRQERHIGDFRDWKSHDAYQEVFQRLLRDLKTDQRAPTPAAVFTTLHRAQATAELDPQRTRLLQLIAQHFTTEELRTLCFQLTVDYDDLPGETKTAKIRELILYFERQRPGGAGTLAEYVRDKRPSAFN